MPQLHRKVNVRWPYGRLAMAVRWHAVFTLSLVPRKSYAGLTASLRRPHGALTAAVRQTCSSCNNREVAVRSPPDLLTVTLHYFISLIVRSPCGRRNICDYNYGRPQDLTIFKNHVLQTVDRRTVRRQHDMWPRHYIGLGAWMNPNTDLSTGPSEAHFNKILPEIEIFALKKCT